MRIWAKAVWARPEFLGQWRRIDGAAVALAISAANRIDDPPAIGRNLRIGDPDEIEQVFFGDGSFRIARLGSRILSGE